MKGDRIGTVGELRDWLSPFCDELPIAVDMKGVKRGYMVHLESLDLHFERHGSMLILEARPLPPPPEENSNAD